MSVLYYSTAMNKSSEHPNTTSDNNMFDSIENEITSSPIGESFEAIVTGSVSPSNIVTFPAGDSSTTIAAQSLSSTGPGYSKATKQAEPPIWLARHVEWPVFTPISMTAAAQFSTISSALYQKLWRASRKAGENLGINSNSSSSFSSNFMGNNTNAIIYSSSNMNNMDSIDSDDNAHISGGYYTALGGLMGRVFTGTGIGGPHSSVGRFSFTLYFLIVTAA